MQSLPSLLLPGHMCDGAMWSLAASVFEQVGAEPMLADLTRDASIEDMAARILDEAPSRFVAMGFSLGELPAVSDRFDRRPLCPKLK